MFTGFVLCVSEFVLAIMECNLERLKRVALICFVQRLKALLGSKCLVEVETVYHIRYALKTHPTLPHLVMGLYSFTTVDCFIGDLRSMFTLSPTWSSLALRVLCSSHPSHPTYCRHWTPIRRTSLGDWWTTTTTR